MVELGGFEPPASAMSMLRSNQLSYNSSFYSLAPDCDPSGARGMTLSGLHLRLGAHETQAFVRLRARTVCSPLF